jgi:hypothetical protein
MLFDEEGLCYTLTVGYVMDKRVGNTGGMGGTAASVNILLYLVDCKTLVRLYLTLALCNTAL